MLFGVISPKISTKTVITTVDNVTPKSPNQNVNTIVAIEAEAMFTILFPISKVDKSLL